MSFLSILNQIMFVAKMTIISCFNIYTHLIIKQNTTAQKKNKTKLTGYSGSIVVKVHENVRKK